jgi:ribosomal-protein-serine acetyltransferase
MKGRHVTLAKPHSSQARLIYNAVKPEMKRLQEFLPSFQNLKALSTWTQWIAAGNEAWGKKEEFSWLIFHHPSGRFAGVVRCHDINAQEGRRGEIGYWILADFEGQGLVTEAVERVQKELFRNGFHRLEIHCSTLNRRSIAIPKALGYVREGVLREHYFSQGHWHNAIVFSKLKSEGISHPFF